jgi:hypothetical protein
MELNACQRRLTESLPKDDHRHSGERSARRHINLLTVLWITALSDDMLAIMISYGGSGTVKLVLPPLLPLLTRLCTIATAVAISSMLFRAFELTLL